MNIEFTDDPHPRNTYWEMWGLPMFDIKDAAAVMMELQECRKVYGDRYVRLVGIRFHARLGIGETFFHRQSSRRGTGIPAGAAGSARTKYAVYHAGVCYRSSGGTAIS